MGKGGTGMGKGKGGMGMSKGGMGMGKGSGLMSSFGKASKSKPQPR